MKSLLDRLKARCLVDDCWHWTGAKDGHGAPVTQIISLNRNSMQVRRLVYLVACGPISKGRVVLTTCGEQDCVNPEHLKLTDKAGLNRLIAETRRPRKTQPVQQDWHP